jgi:hypothetical protein
MDEDVAEDKRAAADLIRCVSLQNKLSFSPH